ncbi:hypothetical protein BSKO_03838 [Bryopsis sp. KO-2023]|nr:hypothetical protein BSKO_03838 [Bryopsis sp. KO-2023]
MGCIPSKSSKGLRQKPKKWASEKPLSREELQAQREEFWDTQPHYGGDRVIWDALRAAFTGDPNMRHIIIESAGIIVEAEDYSVCYDEKGAKYELPKFILSDPTNLIEEKRTADSAQVQLSVQS